MPDGRVARFEVPEGTTPEQAQQMILGQLGQQEEKKSPTDGMSTTDKVLAGVGQGMTSAVRALGGGSLLAKYGLPATKEEAEQLDAPLKATTAGKVGSVLGMGAVAAPVALVPGANTYLGATGLGFLTGAALTEGDAGDRLEGGAWGAAGGAFGKSVGDGLGWAARKLLDYRAASSVAQQVANAQKDAAVATAQKAGYVIPPADVKQSFANEVLNGVSGKIKTAQVASARNQTTTNNLAKQAIGVAEDVPLNVKTLNAIRNEAGNAYEAVSSVGTVQPNKAYFDTLDKIVEPYVRSAKSFPNSKPSPLIGEIDALRTPAFDAGDAVAKIRVLRADADAAYGSGNKEAGKALKSAADALEQAIDDHLSAAGPSQLLANFRDARKLIAKTYTVQKGLNDTTGDVSAQVMANLLKKGKPLEGELRTIAEVSNAFPKATQALKEAPKSISPLDYAVGAMTGASTGNPLMLGAMMARPAARSVILSQPYQSRMLANSYAPGLLDTVGLPALQSNVAKRLMIGTGIGQGLLVPAE